MPIQQHPLPQDISSYRFRLIGDMTVRQFLYIAGFIILTILLHNSPIPFFFRYPLEILSLGLGIGLAFVPIHGRPLDQWIIAFIRSIYSPTQYTWQQRPSDRPAADIDRPSADVTGRPLASVPKSKSQTPQTLPTSTTTLNLTPSHRGPTLRPSADIVNQPLASVPRPQNANARSVRLAPLAQDDKKNPPTVTPTKPTSPRRSLDEGGPTSKPPTTNLPIPFTPEQPNTIVGLTLTPQGLILDGVLIEIISNGLTIRATKSNKLGQFLFAKALENGLYQIKAEKDNFQFTTYSINLEGNIVKPLKIQAKS
jgi:hypothetical protein